MVDIRKKLQVGKQTREFLIPPESIDSEKRTVTLSFSSEEPIERWFGVEILDHSSVEAADLTRLRKAGAVLIDHDPVNQVGVIEEVFIDPIERKGRAIVRFGRSNKAEEIFQDVTDGIRRNVSVGYTIDEMVLEKEGKNGAAVYRVTKWTPYEISLVSIPADITVGVGRKLERKKEDVMESMEKEENVQKVRTIPNTQDTHTDTENALKKELERVVEIRAMGKAHGFDELAKKYISDGKSIDEFRTAILESMKRDVKPIDMNLGMTKKEAERYSYARALSDAIQVAEGKRVKSFEMDVSEEIQRRMPTNHRDHGGVYIPLVKRALTSDASGAGAELVYTEYGGELIELLRNRTILTALGARIMSGLTGPISFPKKASEGSASWVAENPGSDVADTDDAYSTVTLTPRSVIRSTAISRQLLTKSTIDAEADIRDSISTSIALAVDRAALHGTGTNQPIGIYSASGVNVVAMGGVPTFGKLIDMVTEVAKDNAVLGTLGWVTTPGMAGKLLQTLVASSAGSTMIWNGRIDDGLVAGYRAIASNQVASNLGASQDEHGLIFGNWADIIVGMFGGLEITVDPYRLKKQAMVEYTIFGMADVLIRHPESFCKATGAKIA